MTASRRTPAGPQDSRQATRPQIADSRPPEKNTTEMAEPDDLPFPGNCWPPGRPGYVIVVDQLRGWQPGTPASLAELLETAPVRIRQPEPDLEAEP